MRFSQHRRLIRSSVESIITALTGQALLVVSGPLAARLLGVENRGQLAGLLLWPGLIVAFGGLGVHTACTYYLSRNPSHERRLLGEIYRFLAVQSVAFTLILGTVLFFWVRGKPEAVELSALPVLALAALIQCQAFSCSMLQGKQRFTAFNICRTLPGAFYALATVIMYVVHVRQLFLFVVAWVAGYALSVVISNTLVLMQTRPDWTKVDGLRRFLISFGSRGLFGALSPVDNLPVDQAAVALFLSPFDLGLYVVGTSFSNLPRFIAQSAGMVAYPVVAARERAGRGQSQGLVWGFFWAVTAMNVASLLVLLALMPFLVHLFFGSAFAGAVPIARLLLVGTTLVASRRILVEGLRGMGRPGATTIAELSMYPWLIVAAPLLMLRAGAVGLAAALAVGYGISLVAALLLAGVRPRSSKEGRPEAGTELTPGEAFAGSTAHSRPLWPGLRLRAALWFAAPKARTPLLLALVAAGSIAVGLAAAMLPAAVTLVVIGVVASMPLIMLARRHIPRPKPGLPEAVEPAVVAEDPLRFARFLYYLGFALSGEMTIRPALSFTLSDWLFLGALLATVVDFLLRRQRLGVAGLKPILWGAGIFSLGALLSTARSDAPLQSLGVTARFFYLTVIWFWLGTVLLRDPKQLRIAITLWVFSAAISGGGAIAQLLFGNVIPGTSTSFGRMTGFTQHINDLGGLESIALLPALMLASRIRAGSWRSLVIYGSLLLVLAGLMLSGSVGSLLAVVAGFAVWLSLGRLRVGLVVALLVVGLGGIWVGNFQSSRNGLSPLQRISSVQNRSGDATVYSRLTTYREAWQSILQDPLIGHGLDGESARVDNGFRAHNVLLLSWFEAGLLGAVGMVVMLFSTGVISRQTIVSARSREEWFLGMALLVSAIAFVVYSMSDDVLYQRFAWIPVAFIVALRAQQLRRKPSEERHAAGAEEDRAPSVRRLGSVAGEAVNGIAQG